MNKNLPGIFLSLLITLLTLTGFSQDFTAKYEFTDVKNNTGKTDPTPPPVVEGITFGRFVASVAVSANSTAGARFSFTNWDLGAVNGSDAFTGAINLNKYYEVIITPQTNYIVDLDSIAFTLQRSGTGIRQYSVRSSVDGFASNLPAKIYPASANLKIVSGNIFQVEDVSTTANEGSKIVLSAAAFKGITSAVTIRFYGFNAEATGGSFSIDNVEFFGSSEISSTAPNLIISATSLAFPATDIKGGTSIQSYTLKGVNLTDPVNVSVSSPYSISETETGTYSTSLVIPAANVAAEKTIFVKFSPTVIGTFQGVVSHSSTGASQREVSLSGDGINPLNLSFNFDACTPMDVPGSGFTAYSVTGDQKWSCSGFGRNGTNGIDMNGFAGGVQENVDWLISPPLNVSTLALPILDFWSRGEFSGATLQLFISTDYNGTGNPNDFTWTELNGSFPGLTNTWKLTDGINLSAYKTFSGFYLAFKYVSSASVGASRWTIDDIRISNRTQLLAVVPYKIDFQEVVSGSKSLAVPVQIQAVGYGDVTINAPSGYELSGDGNNYFNSIIISDAVVSAGTNFYIRFSPSTRQLKIAGDVQFTGTGLDSLVLFVTGSSYPKAVTFDAGAYNLSFFGSNPTNNPTQEKIDIQVNNIAAVLNRLSLDVVGFEEMSNDEALDSLIVRLPNHKAVTSPRWSYSFDAPDPLFPPQKIGFIYDSVTMKLVSSRPMFEKLYDDARTTDPSLIPSYPTGSPSSFWASGRLPFLATFDVTIKGVTKRIHMIDIHGKSTNDLPNFNRRKYDMQVLKDTLDMYFANENVIIVGDYNDRAYTSIYTSSPVSPFQSLVDDPNYTVLTLPLDIAKQTSFIGGSGLIDHITITNDLNPFYIQSSTQINDPRSYISGYNASTGSDHLPVLSRFDFATVLPVTLISFSAEEKGNEVIVKWTATREMNSNYYEVERSLDAVKFSPIGHISSKGNNSGDSRYEIVDSAPAEGINFYRLKQVDKDSKVMYSLVVAVNRTKTAINKIAVYPNPVNKFITLTVTDKAQVYSGKLINAEGRIILNLKGNVYQVNQHLNNNIDKLKAGLYVLKLADGKEQFSLRFIKE
jgi:hypothetical protein